MPDYRTSLRLRLQDDTPLGDIVGPNIDWGKRPDNLVGLTAVVLTTMADPQEMHFKGRQGLRETTVQIDCYSGISIEEAVAAANRIVEIITVPAKNVDGVRFDQCFVEGPEDSGNQEETLYVHRARLVARVWHALV